MTLPVGHFAGKIVDSGGDETYYEKPYVFLIIEVNGCDGEHMVKLWLSTEENYARTDATLRELGWKGVDASDVSEIHGKACSVTTREETFQGTTEVKIAFVNAPTPARRLTKEQFAAKYSARLIEMSRALRNKAPVAAAPRGGKAPTPPAANAFDPGTDDVPF